jgi:hypothetical protein
MSKQTAENRQPETATPDRAQLDRKYGNIGISAVVAALRYGGATKNPAYAPAIAQPRGRSEFDTRSVFAI